MVVSNKSSVRLVPPNHVDWVCRSVGRSMVIKDSLRHQVADGGGTFRNSELSSRQRIKLVIVLGPAACLPPSGHGHYHELHDRWRAGLNWAMSVFPPVTQGHNK